VNTRVAAAALAAIALVAVAAGRLFAQAPAVGDLAPDFTLKGSTKDGLLPKPIHLADFRGQTVVIAFFPKARTKG
jgi:thioredoxin-dependent peroxiredoxin